MAGAAGRGKGGVKWKGMDELKTKVGSMPNATGRILTAITQYHAASARGKMKANAGWIDRTGNARNGLDAQAFGPAGRKTGEYGIVLYGQVEYQIYLETKFDGRYAIILPTLQIEGTEMMKTVADLFSQIKIGG